LKTLIIRHCKERSDEAIQEAVENQDGSASDWRECWLDCFAALAMTGTTASACAVC
jgi:hypothetical protein